MEALKQGDVVDLKFGYGADNVVVTIEAHWCAKLGFLFNNKSVAEAFGVAESNVRKHKMKDEVRQEHHWVLESEAFPERQLSGRPATYWTYRGVWRVGMMVKGERAQAFRDAIEELVSSFEHPENQDAYEREDMSMALMGKESRRPNPTKRLHKDNRFVETARLLGASDVSEEEKGDDHAAGTQDS